MPARKPFSLNVRHNTQAEKTARAVSEGALTPRKRLTITPPAELKGSRIAQGCWRRLIRLYDELEGDIVTRLDGDLLCEYCLLFSELAGLRRLKEEAIKRGDLDDVLRIDQRGDRKGSRLDLLRQQLYLTPRSRSAASPDIKEVEEKPVLPKGAIVWADFVKAQQEKEGD
jgi:phage terminase small subunit